MIKQPKTFSSLVRLVESVDAPVSTDTPNNQPDTDEAGSVVEDILDSLNQKRGISVDEAKKIVAAEINKGKLSKTYKTYLQTGVDQCQSVMQLRMFLTDRLED